MNKKTEELNNSLKNMNDCISKFGIKPAQGLERFVYCASKTKICTDFGSNKTEEMEKPKPLIVCRCVLNGNKDVEILRSLLNCFNMGSNPWKCELLHVSGSFNDLELFAEELNVCRTGTVDDVIREIDYKTCCLKNVNRE